MTATIEERLYMIRYKADEGSHLTIKNQTVCEQCPTKECTFFCPADVYHWNSAEQMTTVAYENCIECGTCRIGCHEHNIKWLYPKGGYGITYKFG
ncbi:4Fe-4S dicluster domain-containing protein [Alicyclobacillus tolerans]|uniref:ferredoxin family protein n=1 Tax=Alicyclobacillus tolerans TaxID=90970 RepID=UPI001F320CC5|nr:4Fe-4S dicluster domain-containing protein [Alicyclobacillus tolerans]MCF8563408.1 4Fe-4S dicluster domain-containing protein [Alicyclobacillus tolerans]